MAAGSADFPAPSQRPGIYRSLENGVTWTRLETIVPDTYVWAMAMCPNEPDRPLIATNGDGVIAARLQPRSGVAGHPPQRMACDA